MPASLKTFRLPLTASLILSAAASATGATLNVPSASYPSLPIAITAAAPGDEIVLAAGTYLAVPGFVINSKQLTLRGATGDPDDVVLDGFGVTGNIVLSILGSGSDGTVLDSITIANGRSATATNSSGAGLHLNNANVTVLNCKFRNNQIVGPDGQGGAIYGTVSDTVIIGCEFTNNTFTSDIGEGGAIYFNSGTHLIEDCSFDGNGAAAGTTPLSGSTGGGIYVDSGGSMQITDSVIANSRGGNGGGVYFNGNAVEFRVDSCEFINNTGIQGGAVYVSSATGSANSRFRNCLFEGNQTTGNDAAIFTNKPAVILNCTFVKNESDAAYIIGGSPAAGSVSISNSIVWGNTANTHVIPAAMSAIARNNTFQIAYAGGGGSASNSTVDPQFVNFAAGDYRLAPTSPAIDAGNTDLYVGPFVDLDGNTRGVDKPDTADTGVSTFGPVIDKGCFEFQIAIAGPSCPGDLTGDDFVNVEDLNEVLGNWNTGCN